MRRPGNEAKGTTLCCCSTLHFSTMSSGARDTLTAKNLGVMLTEVLDWHKLGTKLDLPGHSLAEIRMDYNVHGTDRQRQEMIGKWLAFDTEASWSKLAGALEEMGEKTAAKSIRDKYVPHCGGTQNGDSNDSAAATAPPKAAKTPTKRELMLLLYREAADKWHAIGGFLEIPVGQLNTIAEKNGNDPQKCLLHLFDDWLARIDPRPTWSAMADAVDLVCNPSLAEKVRKMEHS